MAHFDGGVLAELFESWRLVRIGFGEDEVPKGAVVLVEAADVEQTINNICLYAVAWVFFFVRGDGLTPLGLVGRICGFGDVGAAEEQGYRREDLVLHRTKGTHLKPPLRCP